MQLKTGDRISYYIYDAGKKIKEGTDQVVGFYCYGMHLQMEGVVPYFNNLNWYDAGYHSDGTQFLYLRNRWMLARAIVFELARTERYGRIMFWE